ncbi:MAG: O-methyltransferase [Actinomycetota bacterium]|nr:O-methyltransferase [Actinomycetota bacterium]
MSARVEAYVEAHSTPPAAHLRELAQATRASLNLPIMLSGPVEARLLETLVFLARPRLVLELGTFSGYSALAMAEALPPDGRIVTCELDDEHADFAERHIAAAGQAGRVEVRRGDALAAIAALEGPFDLVFIDADKPRYVAYYEAVVPKLAERGVIVADNTLSGGDVADERPDARAATLAAFNAHVAADPRTVQVMLTVRDGVTLIRRAR